MGARAAVTLFAVACGLYANTLHHGFTFDDNFAVVGNPDVFDRHQALSGLLRNDFWGQRLDSEQSHKSYRPLTVLAFRLEHHIGDALLKGQQEPRPASGDGNGGDSHPLPFHAANVLLHGLVTLLVHRVALRLACLRDGCTQQPAERQPSSAARQACAREALLAAALFACHPVHTEAVAGVVGQAELLCASLSLAAFLAYLCAASCRGAGGMLAWLALALGGMLAAALAKEIGITMAGAMVLSDLLLAARPGSGGSRAAVAVRWAAVAVAVWLYVGLRSCLAVSHVVSIYRRVENPIPFEPAPLTRALTTGYLHARYAWLLLFPAELSADWSFACIPPLHSLADARNAATAALYACLLLPLLALQPGAPWRLGAGAPADARWQAAVLFGLLVGPFFPASNVLFYVGTFIGERLLYLPSVGFCLLAARLLASFLGCQGPPPAEGGQGPPPAKSGPAAQEAPAVVTGGRRRAGRWAPRLAVGLLLAACSWKTVSRNADWADEESLFAAAQKVCWRSAKVQLNSGILARRRGAWPAAEAHLRLARSIEPDYCEPAYWIGITLVQRPGRLQEGLEELQQALGCKYVAVQAAEALARVFAALRQQEPGDVRPALEWARILMQPPLSRRAEACEVLEEAAAAVPQHAEAAALLEPCLAAPGGSGEQQCLAARCLQQRLALRRRAAAAGPTDAGAKAELYAYLGRDGQACRQQGQSGHALLVNALQKADPEDAWLHLEWGRLLLEQERGTEAGVHFRAAGLLLRRWVVQAEGIAGASLLGVHPATGAVGGLGRAAAAAASLQAMQLFQQSPGAEPCVALPEVCRALSLLQAALAAGDVADSAAAIAEAQSPQALAGAAQACDQALAAQCP